MGLVRSDADSCPLRGIMVMRISPAFCTMANPLLLWAKSPAKGQSDGYPLLPHLLDVAAVASKLQQTIPCPVPMPCSPAWVSALVGFHDLGKATPGFQKKLGRDSIPNYPFLAGAPDRHDASTVPLLTTQLEQQGISRCDAWLLASAVGAHHGHLIDSTEQQKAGRSVKYLDTAWHEAHKHLFTQLLEGIGADGYPTLSLEKPQQAVFLQWLMGLTTVSDWIGSSEALCRWDRLECSPHTRGWTGERCCAEARRIGVPRTRGDGPLGRCRCPVWILVFPAHAGMDRHCPAT